MRILILLSLSLFFMGCSAIPLNSDEAGDKKYADYIKERSGFIENGVARLIEIAITGIPEGFDKQHYINVVHEVASNVNLILSQNRFDADSIRKAFKIEDPAVQLGVALAGELLIQEINRLKNNGYVDFAASLVQSASKGIMDGTAGQSTYALISDLDGFKIAYVGNQVFPLEGIYKKGWGY